MGDVGHELTLLGPFQQCIHTRYPNAGVPLRGDNSRATQNLEPLHRHVSSRSAATAASPPPSPPCESPGSHLPGQPRRAAWQSSRTSVPGGFPQSSAPRQNALPLQPTICPQGCFSCPLDSPAAGRTALHLADSPFHAGHGRPRINCLLSTLFLLREGARRCRSRKPTRGPRSDSG